MNKLNIYNIKLGGLHGQQNIYRWLNQVKKKGKRARKPAKGTKKLIRRPIINF